MTSPLRFFQILREEYEFLYHSDNNPLDDVYAFDRSHLIDSSELQARLGSVASSVEAVASFVEAVAGTPASLNEPALKNLVERWIRTLAQPFLNLGLLELTQPFVSFKHDAESIYSDVHALKDLARLQNLSLQVTRLSKVVVRTDAGPNERRKKLRLLLNLIRLKKVIIQAVPTFDDDPISWLLVRRDKITRVQLISQDSQPSEDQLVHILNKARTDDSFYQTLFEKSFFATVQHHFTENTRNLIQENPEEASKDPYTRRIVLEEAYAEELRKVDDERLSKVYAQIYRKDHMALCLSGGGIRSAAFNLGVLQSLARSDMLGKFHYLSTISGGGYIGSWLSAWIHRKGLNEVVKELKNNPPSKLAPDPVPIRHLRHYRNYLSPRLKMLSADTWTLVATFLRTVFLNWTVLIPALLAALAVPRLGVAIIQADLDSLSEVLLVLGFILVTWAIAIITKNLPRATDEQVHSSKIGDPLGRCVLLLVLSSICLTTFWAWLPKNAASPHSWHFIAFGALMNVVGVTFVRWRKFFTIEFLATLIALIVIGGIVGGFVAWLVATQPLVFANPKENSELYVTLAAPLLVLLFLLTADLLVGVMSRKTSDQHREWKVKLNGLLLLVSTAWIAVSTLVLFGPHLLEKFPEPLGSVGGLSGLIALILGFSDRTKENKDSDEQQRDNWQSLLRKTILNLTAPIAIAVVIVALSWCMSWLMIELGQKGLSSKKIGGLVALGIHIHHPNPNFHQIALMESWYFISALVLTFSIIGVLLSFVMDINRFSIHATYRDRLVRTFLGASRKDRRPDVTGLDPKDDIEMYELRVRTQKSDAQAPYRLFHVLNLSLNTVTGRNLAWQDRKAQSFTVTPLHCGSWPLGYRSSEFYGQRPFDKKKITLGTALAISGAAASPNMGYHSSPPVTFLMTLFNLRLGWWLGNPGIQGNWYAPRLLTKLFSKLFSFETWKRAWGRSYPRFALLWWYREAFGLTNEDAPYVYLSDGGHFENLGLYEMVLRRCRYIVVSDASCDPDYSYDSLGNAIRKIKLDLGIDIELDLEILKGDTSQQMAIGLIRYDRVDEIIENDSHRRAPVGLLVYLKASLSGDEPAEVQEYKRSNSAFPHDTTSNQFFGEGQFEAYRRLGEHIADKTFKTFVFPPKIVNKQDAESILPSLLLGLKQRLSWEARRYVRQFKYANDGWIVIDHMAKHVFAIVTIPIRTKQLCHLKLWTTPVGESFRLDEILLHQVLNSVGNKWPTLINVELAFPADRDRLRRCLLSYQVSIDNENGDGFLVTPMTPSMHA